VADSCGCLAGMLNMSPQASILLSGTRIKLEANIDIRFNANQTNKLQNAFNNSIKNYFQKFYLMEFSAD